MAVNRDPIVKKCKHLGIEPADLGYSKKFKKDANPRRKKMSEYALQLKEKQKAKFIYGVLEKQFRNNFKMATKQQGIAGENMLINLERRLDNVVFRMGFARTRREARQIVGHKLILLNGKGANIPSMKVKTGDTITIKEKYLNSDKFKQITATTSSRSVPEWLSSDKDKLQGTVVSLPNRAMIDVPVNETLIVELYSK